MSSYTRARRHLLRQYERAVDRIDEEDRAIFLGHRVEELTRRTGPRPATSSTMPLPFPLMIARLATLSSRRILWLAVGRTSRSRCRKGL